MIASILRLPAVGDEFAVNVGLLPVLIFIEVSEGLGSGNAESSCRNPFPYIRH